MQDDRARELLAAERERLERALAELSPEAGDELARADPQSGDAGSDLHAEELDAGLAMKVREELDALERAERRLAEGQFGVSVDSGEPIPDARLEAMPSAERTVDEQSRYDGRR